MSLNQTGTALVRIVAVVTAMSGAGTSVAEPFSVIMVDAIQSGSSGVSPFTVNGTLFQASIGTNSGGSSGHAIDTHPQLAYDTYLAIATGPSAGGNPQIKNDGFHANPGDLNVLGPAFQNPGLVDATWFMIPPFVQSQPVQPLGGSAGLFLGRFSFRTTDGSTPTGSIELGTLGIDVAIRDHETRAYGPGRNVAHIEFLAFDTPVFMGFHPADFSPFVSSVGYTLTRHTFEANVGTARFLVHDLYILQGAENILPAPATVLLAGGFLMTQRRSRR